MVPQCTEWRGCLPSHEAGYWVLGLQATEPRATDTVVQGTLAICKDNTDLTNIDPHPPSPGVNCPRGSPSTNEPPGSVRSGTLWALGRGQFFSHFCGPPSMQPEVGKAERQVKSVPASPSATPERVSEKEHVQGHSDRSKIRSQLSFPDSYSNTPSKSFPAHHIALMAAAQSGPAGWPQSRPHRVFVR